MRLLGLKRTEETMATWVDEYLTLVEREACAKVCEEVGFAVHGPGREDSEAYDCADAIRARGGEK